MSRRLLLTTALAASLACEVWRERAPAVPEPVVEFPRPRREVVAGVPLLTIPAQVGTAAVGVSLRLGSASDPADRPGLTTLLLTLLRGHGERPDGLAAALGELGGVPELSFGRDGALLSTEVPREHAPAALRALIAAVRTSPGDPDELAAITAELAAARARTRDDPDALALAALHHVAFPSDHPYRRSQLSAGTWSIEHVLEFHRASVGPATAAIVVAGEFDRAAVTAAATAALAGWRGPARLSPAPAPVPVLARAIHLVPRPGLAQAVITLGNATSTSDDLAAHIAAIFVQNALHARLRGDMAATYRVEVGGGLARGPGLVYARTEVDAGAVGPALTALRDTLAALGRVPPGADTVTRVCQLERLEPMFQRQSNAALQHAAARLHWFDLPIDHDERRAARDCAGLAPAVAQALRAGLASDHLQIVVVADPSRVESALLAQGLGPIARIEPTDL